MSLFSRFCSFDRWRVFYEGWFCGGMVFRRMKLGLFFEALGDAGAELILVIESFLAFCLVRVAPGRATFDKERAPAWPDIERTRKAKHHLDDPLWKLVHLRFVGIGFDGDRSAVTSGRRSSIAITPVNDIIAQGLPVSALSLGFVSFGFALGVAHPLGVRTALRRGRWQRSSRQVFSILAVCIPAFVLGPILIVLLGVKWPVFPRWALGRPVARSCRPSRWARTSPARSPG